jgi:hypothetical protein
MSMKNTNFYTEEHVHLIDELQNQLERQIKLIHKGDHGGRKLEELSMQTDALVEKITQSGVLKRPEFVSKKEKLKKSYEDLRLAVTAQRADTVERLSRLRRGRKIVKTYRGKK